MVTGTIDRWLQPGVMLRRVYERLIPELRFVDMVTKRPEDDPTFMYGYNDVTMLSDPKKRTPPLAKIGGLLPELDYTREKTTSAATKSRGFALRLTHDMLLKSKRAAEEIKKANLRAGVWMAEFINGQIMTAMNAGATTPVWIPTKVWSDPDSTPIIDLEKFGEQFSKNEGYNFHFTDAYIDGTNWHELRRYVLDYDNRWIVGGPPKIDRDQIYIPSLDLKVHKWLSGVTHGTVLGLDATNPVAEYHYFNDPEYSTANVSYETIVNDKKTVKTVKNMGIHFDKVKENDTKDYLLQYWYESKTIITNALGILKGTGI
jgi:hypothetical protein